MTGSSSTTTSPQQNASKSANDTPIQSPKNKERLKAVFYYRKSLLTQYIQALDNLRIMNAEEIQALRSVILVTKNNVGDFHHVFKLDNMFWGTTWATRALSISISIAFCYGF